MPKPISPTLHGVIDYLTVPLLIAAGPLFGLEPLAGRITSTLAGAVLVWTASTSYPPGILKIVSLKLHRVVDLVVGLCLIVSAWALGFHDSKATFHFFVFFGLFLIVLAMLTDFTGKSRSSGNVKSS